MNRILPTIVALTLSLAPFISSAQAQNAAAQTHALFDRYTQDIYRLYPEAATFRGDHRYGDRLRDRSPEGIAAEDAYWRALHVEVKAIDRAALSRDDHLSVELLQRITEDESLLRRSPGYLSMTVHAGPFPFQGVYVRLFRASPTATAVQAEQVIARYDALGRRMDQEIANMKRGMAQRWVPPRPVLKEVLSQLDKQLAASPDKSAYFEPFTRLGNDIAQATREALRERALKSIEASVLPAVRRLRDFVAGEYLAGAPEEGGLERYPGGKEAYAALVRVHTTTSLTPQEVHKIGLEQVEILRGQIAAVMKEVNFTGEFAAFVKFANSDPRFFYTNGADLVAGYREITKRVDPELPRLFAELPRTPYGVRAMPDFLGPGAAEFYDAPALDGSRPGWFNANAAAFATKPKWGMESIALHEAVPGHHLQFARAYELKGVPAFRRSASFTAYAEGWALYAETLGPELGMYRDPLSKFGFLQNQIWRAVRLVVDTGLHAHGWTRQQAIDYMAKETGFGTDKCQSEIDRYISWPAQALSYMIGQLKFTEIRQRASKALGARFDVRRFHMVVLDSGMLPMNLLEQVVDEWIAVQLR